MMFRAAMTVCFGVSVCVLSVGCANYFESRAISRFDRALDKKDVAALKAGTSIAFQQKALRHAKALDDIEILNLPTGKTTVLKVAEGETKDEKNVWVAVGKRKKKLQYKLVKDKKTGRWVVDNVLIKQKKQGAEIASSVTEQMDLLLTMREFLETWDGGKRDKILAVTTPEFRDVLAELPDAYLKRLAREVIGKNPTRKRLKPKAELDEDNAIVTLPRTSSNLVMNFKQLKGKWRVSDIVVEAKTEKAVSVPSVLKTATALRTSLRFLKAFAAADKPTLEKLCTKRLYNDGLAHSSRADLSSVRLIPDGVDTLGYEITMLAHRGNFLLRGKKEWMRIALIKNTTVQQTDAPAEYVVEGVTIYKLDPKQEIRLSSLFMAKEILRVFASAMATQDRDVLRKISTGEFNRRVWDIADATFMKTAIPVELVMNPPQILDTEFLGPVTRIDVRHGRRNFTYVLRDRGGRVRVDDILSAQPGLPASLRARLELQLPIYRFGNALLANDIPTLQRNSSKEYNRMIWKHAKSTPPVGALAPKYLRMPVTAIIKNGDKTIVTLGSPRRGAEVLLVTEYSRPVVDDVRLLDGISQVQVRRLMRLQMTGGQRVTPIIQQSQYTETRTPRQLPRSTRQSARPLSSFSPDDSAFADEPMPQPNQRTTNAIRDYNHPLNTPNRIDPGPASPNFAAGANVAIPPSPAANPFGAPRAKVSGFHNPPTDRRGGDFEQFYGSSRR